MVAFIASLIVMALLVGLIVVMAKRRPVGTPITWGEAMVAGTYTFFLFFWVYGVVPHLWLTWADNELKWRPDKLLFGPGDILKPQKFDGWSPITVSYQTIRDLIAVTIYAVLLGATMAMFAYWQNRGKRAEAAAAAQIETSDYGRPLVKKA